MGSRIFHRTGLALCCRSRLSSNVRPHKTYHCGTSTSPNPMAATRRRRDCRYRALPAICRCNERLPCRSCCAKTVLHVVRQATAGTCPRRHSACKCGSSLSACERRSSGCVPRFQKSEHAVSNRYSRRYAALLPVLGCGFSCFSLNRPPTRSQAISNDSPNPAVNLVPVVGAAHSIRTMAWVRVLVVASAAAR